MGDPDKTSLDDQTTPELEFDSQMRTKAVFIFHFFLSYLLVKLAGGRKVSISFTLLFFFLR